MITLSAFGWIVSYTHYKYFKQQLIVVEYLK